MKDIHIRIAFRIPFTRREIVLYEIHTQTNTPNQPSQPR